MSKTGSVACLLAIMSLASIVSAKEAQVPLKDLKAQADEVLKQDNVSARSDVAVVFSLVDRLLEEKRMEEAVAYLVQGLKLFPWNLKYQMVYAELLAKKGDQKKAEEKASLVLESSETDELATRAQKILKRNPLPEFPAISAVPGTNYCVVLIPFQGCDKWLIARVQGELAAELHIPVLVQTVDVSYPPFSRDRRQKVIEGVRAQLMGHLEDKQVAEAMRQLSLGKEDLKDDGKVIRLMKQVMKESGAEAVAQLDAFLSDSTGQDPQWDADLLLTTLIQAVKPLRRANVAYLGLTPVDIYANDFGFLFGWSSTQGAVVSYRRFTADYNRDIPNQARLAKRTLMQCLSSVGLVNGIKRCTDPTCARAYPHSLSEHDAKKGTLCPECRDGFMKKFGQ